MLEIEYNNFDHLFSTEFENNKALTESTILDIVDLIDNSSPYFKIFNLDLAHKSAIGCKDLAKRIRSNFSDVILIGMGGAVLNPMTVLSCNPENMNTACPSIHFLHNTDPIYLKKLLNKISLDSTAVITISNSGKTLETKMLARSMIAEYEKQNISKLGDHFFFITNPKQGDLHKIAQHVKGTVIEHENNISGRFSGLSNVTSLVAQICNIDFERFLHGASIALDDYRNNSYKSQAGIAANQLYSAYNDYALDIMVNIGYLQNFSAYLEWYSQIIAESLGKNNGGISPIRGLGPNDQHSMLQLYLEGKKDKIYSLFYFKDIKTDFETNITGDESEDSVKSLYAVNYINFLATKRALTESGLPVRTLVLEDFSEESVGNLITYSMLEIITLGKMMKLNPFNQPGVELIKNAAKTII